MLGEPGIMQAIVRDAVIANVIPNLAVSPVYERVYLYKTVDFVPLCKLHGLTGNRLLATQPAYPRFQAGKSTAQRLKFAETAPLFPLFYAFVKKINAIGGNHLFNFAEIGKIYADFYTVVNVGAVKQTVDFGEKPSSVESKDVGTFGDFYQHVG
jgi:hypothetical protein